MMAATTQIKEGDALTWGNTSANIGFVGFKLKVNLRGEF